jgi:hypothetical protein
MNNNINGPVTEKMEKEAKVGRFSCRLPEIKLKRTKKEAARLMLSCTGLLISDFARSMEISKRYRQDDNNRFSRSRWFPCAAKE